MSRVQFLAQADGFFRILLQPSSKTHPASYPKLTLHSYSNSKFSGTFTVLDFLCGLVVRVSGYRYRGPGFDSWRYQIF
jgi:hypothetical protein